MKQQEESGEAKINGEFNRSVVEKYDKEEENKTVHDSGELEKDTDSLKINGPTEEVQQKTDDEDHDESPKDASAAPASPDASVPSESSWKPKGGLARNLLDILMSPFTRKTRTH